MLRPSYAELMDIMSENSKEAVTSRYTVVIAAAKRARQLIDGDESMAEEIVNSNKPVSIAVEEINEGKIIVVSEGQGTKVKPKESIDVDIKKELEETVLNSVKTKIVAEDLDDISIDLEDIDEAEDFDEITEEDFDAIAIDIEDEIEEALEEE